MQQATMRKLALSIGLVASLLVSLGLYLGLPHLVSREAKLERGQYAKAYAKAKTQTERNSVQLEHTLALVAGELQKEPAQSEPLKLLRAWDAGAALNVGIFNRAEHQAVQVVVELQGAAVRYVYYEATPTTFECKGRAASQQSLNWSEGIGALWNEVVTQSALRSSIEKHTDIKAESLERVNALLKSGRLAELELSMAYITD